MSKRELIWETLINTDNEDINELIISYSIVVNTYMEN